MKVGRLKRITVEDLREFKEKNRGVEIIAEMQTRYKALNLGFRYGSVLEFCHIVSYGVTERAKRAGPKGNLKEVLGTLDNINLKYRYNLKYRFF